MGEVIVYANSPLRCYCQIKLDNRERVFISIVSTRNPSVKVTKLSLFGLWPSKILWEYNPARAGGEDEFFQNIIEMFPDPLSLKRRHPLDIISERLLQCKSSPEVQAALLDAERQISV